ncbi:hypothetical protein OTK49_03365 [Vibrio coralliirubri]|uniref:hypothetical protein n=1 Tax=Vibrio coralliirubri TaxID=1516159 RepID=UPI002283F18D|nr:hypothetical protein [Vibrio coralliirubri]MCY9861556.1 hypothetical protein [Vibrio coralliirubri]
MKNKRYLLSLSSALGDLSQKLSLAYSSASDFNKFHKQHLRKISLAPLHKEPTNAERRAWEICDAVRRLFDTDESILDKGVNLVVDGVEDHTTTRKRGGVQEFYVSIKINSKDVNVHCCNGYISVDHEKRERYYDFERITINGTTIEDELSGDLAAMSIINVFFTNQLLEQAFDFGDDIDTTLNDLDDKQIDALVALFSIN